LHLGIALSFGELLAICRPFQTFARTSIHAEQRCWAMGVRYSYLRNRFNGRGSLAAESSAGSEPARSEVLEFSTTHGHPEHVRSCARQRPYRTRQRDGRSQARANVWHSGSPFGTTMLPSVRAEIVHTRCHVARRWSPRPPAAHIRAHRRNISSPPHPSVAFFGLSLVKLSSFSAHWSEQKSMVHRNVDGCGGVHVRRAGQIQNNSGPPQGPLGSSTAT
jgi:hypothetical protein